MDNKKVAERYDLIKFISNPELNLRVTSIIDSETPDFIVETLDNKISIELTRLTNPDLKKVEEFRNKIIKKAEILFREKYNADLRCLITFQNVELKGGTQQIEKYSYDIFSLIENIYSVNKDFDFDITLKEGKHLNNFISRLHINNKLGFNNWQHFGAYKVDRISLDWLKNKILLKEESIKKYKKQSDENWLLLISNFWGKSSTHDFDFLTSQDINTLSNTAFDKVFVYLLMENRTIKIK